MYIIKIDPRSIKNHYIHSWIHQITVKKYIFEILKIIGVCFTLNKKKFSLSTSKFHVLFNVLLAISLHLFVKCTCNL